MPPIFSSLYTLGMINFESGGINFPAFQKVEGVLEVLSVRYLGLRHEY